MVSKIKSKLSRHEKKRRKSAIVVSILALGLILTTLLAILNTALN